MENDAGEFVDLYCPRKWYVSLYGHVHILNVLQFTASVLSAIISWGLPIDFESMVDAMKLEFSFKFINVILVYVW